MARLILDATGAAIFDASTEYLAEGVSIEPIPDGTATASASVSYIEHPPSHGGGGKGHGKPPKRARSYDDFVFEKLLEQVKRQKMKMPTIKKPEPAPLTADELWDKLMRIGKPFHQGQLNGE
jgi:hypothetical protein